MKRSYKLTALACVLALTSCNHQELCYDHPPHATRYQANIIADYRYDWEEHYSGTDWETNWPAHYLPYDGFRPVKPSGLRVVKSNIEGKSDIHNLPADGGTISLYEGVNDLLFYNNDTEYILFSRQDGGATTRATTRSRSRASYVESKYANEGEETVNAPDMLYGNFIDDYLAVKQVEPSVIEVTLHPLVFTYKIRYEFQSGLEYVSLVRGALTGMARSVLMNTGYTSAEPATILYDCEKTGFGARAVVRSFGVPDFPNANYGSRATDKHALNLEVMLRNGNMLSFDFDVTEQVKAQPHGGVIVVKGIVINEEDGKAGSGGFDVTVNDWGEYEDIELPM